MKILGLAVFTILISAVNFYADQTNKWTGIYTFEEESWDENQARESRWFRLEVTKKDSKTLTAIYSDGLDNKTFNKFLLTVVPTKNNVIFNFETDLANIEIPCSDGLVKGEKLLELKEIKNKDGKPLIQTIWGKMNYGNFSEKGGGSVDKIFFRKN